MEKLLATFCKKFLQKTGRLKTEESVNEYIKAKAVFQFLIGRLKTYDYLGPIQDQVKFQFLIGRLKTTLYKYKYK